MRFIIAWVSLCDICFLGIRRLPGICSYSFIINYQIKISTCYSKGYPHQTSGSALTLVVAHIDLYLYNPHQTSASYPFSSIYAAGNADADTDTRCDQGQRIWSWPGLNTIQMWFVLLSPVVKVLHLKSSIYLVRSNNYSYLPPRCQENPFWFRSAFKAKLTTNLLVIFTI